MQVFGEGFPNGGWSEESTITSKTQEGRSATFRVQGLDFYLASIAARFLVPFFLKKKFFETSQKKRKNEMKRHARQASVTSVTVRRDTKVLEFVKLIFATPKVAINLEKWGADCWARILSWLREILFTKE